MIWVRRSLVFLFSVLLLLSLVGGALAYGINDAASKPDKIKTWLKESKIYENFRIYAAEEGQKSATSQSKSGSKVLSDSEVREAAEAAFPTEFLEDHVNKFLDSNYAWLQGKTSTPDFAIDLADTKQGFAEEVGQNVESHLESLLICTDAQLEQAGGLENIDPLTADCRPGSLDPAAIGAQVTQSIVNSDNFLSNPVVTPQSIDPENNGQEQPYYVKLSKAPQAYQLGQKLPVIAVVLALISVLAIVLIAPLRRRGVRRVGIVLATAGILLLFAKFLTGIGSKQIENKVFNDAGSGPLQKSLADFLKRLQDHVNTIDTYFALAFLALAALIFIYLFRSKKRGGGPTDGRLTPARPGSTVAPTRTTDNIRLAPRRNSAAPDIRGSKRSDSNKPPRPPRLVQ